MESIAHMSINGKLLAYIIQQKMCRL